MDQSFMDDVPEEPLRYTKRKKVKKPYKILYRATRSSLFFRDWCTYNKYKDLETATKALVFLKRKEPYFDFKIKDESHEDS